MVWPLIVAGVQFVTQLGAAQKAKEVASLNAQAYRLRALDARTRGVEDVNRLRLQARALMGEQKAAFASQNVSVNRGVATDVAGDTAYLTELDAITLLNNAAREAWSFQQEANITQYEGASQAQASTQQGIGSLIGGLGSYFGGAS